MNWTLLFLTFSVAFVNIDSQKMVDSLFYHPNEIQNQNSILLKVIENYTIRVEYRQNDIYSRISMKLW